MSDEGMNRFMEYLDNLEEMIDLFRGLELSTDIISELPLTEEQITLGNYHFKKLQDKWCNNFVKLLEHGIEWIEYNNGGTLESDMSKKQLCGDCKHLEHDGMFGIFCGVRGDNTKYNCSKYEERS